MKRPATRPSAGWPKAIPGRVYAITSQGHVQSGTRHDAGQTHRDIGSLTRSQVKAQELHHNPEAQATAEFCEELAGRVYDNLEKLKSKKKQNEIRAKQKEEASKQVFDQQKANKQEATFEARRMIVPSRARTAEEKKKKAKEMAAARKSRATITGFSEDDQNKALMALMAACHQYDFEELQKGLGIAATNQFEPSETLNKAKEPL
eukprot:s2479_g4.t1